MYDELIEELRRHHCDAKEDDTQEVCEECAYDVIIADKSVPSGIASVCVCGLMNRSADAIEGLVGFVQEAERDRDEYRERLDKANDAIEELQKRVPKAPHGRLIDADALIEKVIAKYLEHERKGEFVFAAAEIKQDIVDLISNAPTIIEAEEGET